MHAYVFGKIFYIENQCIMLANEILVKKNGMQAYFFSGVSDDFPPGGFVGLAKGLFVGDEGFSG